MIWLVMGNDLLLPYDPRKMREVYTAATKLIQHASAWVPEQRMVFGGSAQMWGYNDEDHPGLYLTYNRTCDTFANFMRKRYGISCITGHFIFEGVTPLDRVGHVSPDDETMMIMTQGFSSLARWGMVKTPPSPFREFIQRISFMKDRSSKL